MSIIQESLSFNSFYHPFLLNFAIKWPSRGENREIDMNKKVNKDN